MDYVEMKKVKDVVKDILTENELARSDNDYLYLLVVQRMCPEITNYHVDLFFSVRANKGLPSYETVTRVRRKLQAENEDYRANEGTVRARAEREQFIREWSVG